MVMPWEKKEEVKTINLEEEYFPDINDEEVLKAPVKIKN